MKEISFVIPCYGSEHTIETVVDEIKNTMSIHNVENYEIVFVNDNSPDGVWSVIQKLVRDNKNTKGISLARNFGQHAALMAGYRACEGEIVVSLDDDGQTPVDQLFLLIDKIREGYDAVYGIYPDTKQSPFRIFGSLVNEMMLNVLLDKPKELKCTSYYAAKKFIIEEMLRYDNAYTYVGGLLLRSTKNIANVEVKHRERLDGKSGYSLGKLLALWFNGCTAFSVKPLRIATIMGCASVLLSMLCCVIVLLENSVGRAVNIWNLCLLSALLFVGGCVMVMLGIIGEYVGRIYICINKAPQYLIREELQHSGE